VGGHFMIVSHGSVKLPLHRKP